jgi:predicted ATPase
MVVPEHEPFDYQLEISGSGVGYKIESEKLSQMHSGYETPFLYIESVPNNIKYYDPETRGLGTLNWQYNHLETSLSQVPKMYQEPEELRRILATASHYHVIDVGVQSPVRRPQAMRPAETPGVDGADLAPYLYYLRETDSAKYEIIIDTLRAAFPSFEDLKFPPVAAGMLAIMWKDKDFEKPFYLHELSEGTIRFLWLVSLLLSSHLSSVTMIDEPELSLHPEQLNLLTDLMRQAAKRTQLIVATHSDRFVSFLQPEEVLVLDSDENGFTNASWADSLN